jgi:hypothetical protein
MSIYSRETDFDDLIFRMDRWDNAGKRLDCCLSASSNLLIGRGVFDAAVRSRGLRAARKQVDQKRCAVFIQ